MAEILGLIIVLIVAGLLIWGGCWAVDKIGAPNPFNWLLKAVVVILVLFFALSRLGVSVPVS